VDRANIILSERCRATPETLNMFQGGEIVANFGAVSLAPEEIALAGDDFCILGVSLLPSICVESRRAVRRSESSIGRRRRQAGDYLTVGVDRQKHLCDLASDATTRLENAMRPFRKTL